MLRIIPQIRLAVPMKSLTPYASLGWSIGVSGKITEARSVNVTDRDYYRKIESTQGISHGLNGRFWLPICSK